MSLYFLYKDCNTLSAFNVAPWKAIGAKSVGGTPANAPVAAIADLQLIKKLNNACVSTPFTKTSDCFKLSISLSFSKVILV